MPKKPSKSTEPEAGRYVLKMESEKEFAKRAPNHPFAHPQITFGGPHQIAPPELPQLPPGGSHGVNLWVSWGYERHDVNISARKWKRIRAGEAVMVKSVGWYEGKSFECRWYFDINEDEAPLIVSYGNDGADGYIGSIPVENIELRNRK